MICNNYKPERTHHCSTCDKCVLVMDHHCPWLNNCVGFKNRKIFILLLIYSLFLSILGLFTVYPLIKILIDIKNGDKSKLSNFIIGCVGFILNIAFLITMIIFLEYHFSLINKNETTIDKLNKERGVVSEYNYD